MTKLKLKNQNVDKQIGARIRTRRMVKGMSQTELGDHLGITFQQIQKYEKGTNRVSCSTLLDIAEFLEIHPNILLTGDIKAPQGKDDFSEMMAEVGAIAMLQAFKRVKDNKQRRSVIQLMEAMGA